MEANAGRGYVVVVVASDGGTRAVYAFESAVARCSTNMKASVQPSENIWRVYGHGTEATADIATAMTGHAREFSMNQLRRVTDADPVPVGCQPCSLVQAWACRFRRRGPRPTATAGSKPSPSSVDRFLFRAADEVKADRDADVLAV